MVKTDHRRRSQGAGSSRGAADAELVQVHEDHSRWSAGAGFSRGVADGELGRLLQDHRHGFAGAGSSRCDERSQTEKSLAPLVALKMMECSTASRIYITLSSCEKVIHDLSCMPCKTLFTSDTTELVAKIDKFFSPCPIQLR